MAVMKTRYFAGLLVGFCLSAAPVVGLAQNIMPMGDSVTARGNTPESSYRYWLWQDLQNAGFTSVAFVGNQNGVSDGTPANTDFDQHYEGGGPADGTSDAWTTQDGINHIADANSRNPDIVLLDLGSNDYDGIQSPQATLAEVRTNLDTIIQGLAAQNPSIIILLAIPTHWEAPDAPTKHFMSGLAGAVSRAAADEKRAGVRVITVNLAAGFNPRKDTVDGTHPNIQGEQKIANRYFQALRKVL